MPEHYTKRVFLQGSRNCFSRTWSSVGLWHCVHQLEWNNSSSTLCPNDYSSSHHKGLTLRDGPYQSHQNAVISLINLIFFLCPFVLINSSVTVDMNLLKGILQKNNMPLYVLVTIAWRWSRHKQLKLTVNDLSRIPRWSLYDPICWTTSTKTNVWWL